MTACRWLALLVGIVAPLVTAPASAQEAPARDRGARVDGTRSDPGPRPEGGLRGRERVDGTIAGGPTHWVVDGQNGTQPMVLPVPVPVPVPRQTMPPARPPLRAGSGPSAAQ